MVLSGDEKGLRRFYAPHIEPSRRSTTIEGDELRHLKKVLRLKEGDELILLDGRGGAFVAVIEELRRTKAVVRILRRLKNTKESPLEITLLQALLKGDKNALLVQKATELGLKRLVLFFTERTVPRPEPKRLAHLKERLERVAIEGLKQCGRTSAPEIEIAGLEDALLLGSPAPLKIIFHPEAEEGLKEALKGGKPPSAVTLAVGPEGGFTTEEIGLARRLGYRVVSCGPRVLRAETMGIASVAIVQYELGDLGL